MEVRFDTFPLYVSMENNFPISILHIKMGGVEKGVVHFINKIRKGEPKSLLKNTMNLYPPFHSCAENSMYFVDLARAIHEINTLNFSRVERASVVSH